MWKPTKLLKKKIRKKPATFYWYKKAKNATKTQSIKLRFLFSVLFLVIFVVSAHDTMLLNEWIEKQNKSKKKYIENKTWAKAIDMTIKFRRNWKLISVFIHLILSFEFCFCYLQFACVCETRIQNEMKHTYWCSIQNCFSPANNKANNKKKKSGRKKKTTERTKSPKERKNVQFEFNDWLWRDDTSIFFMCNYFIDRPNAIGHCQCKWNKSSWVFGTTEAATMPTGLSEQGEVKTLVKKHIRLKSLEKKNVQKKLRCKKNDWMNERRVERE